jgi:hypothetical protein
MTIRAITDILQDAISTRCVKILGANNKTPKLRYVKEAFLTFDKGENHSTLRAFPLILHS